MKGRNSSTSMPGVLSQFCRTLVQVWNWSHMTILDLRVYRIFTSYSLMYHSIHFKMTKNNLHTTQTLHGITYYESPTQVYRFGNSSCVLSNQKTWRLRNLTWEKLRLVGSFSPSVCDSIAYKIYLHKTHLPGMKYRDMPTHWHISSPKKWSHVSLVV